MLRKCLFSIKLLFMAIQLWHFPPSQENGSHIKWRLIADSYFHFKIFHHM